MFTRPALIAAIATLVAAAPASASIFKIDPGLPGIPIPTTPQPQREPSVYKKLPFTVTATAEQYTQWSEPEHDTGSDCYHRFSQDGQGHELVKLSSNPEPFLLYKQMAGNPWQVQLGSYTPFTMPKPWIGVVHGDRVGSQRNFIKPGDCGASQEPPVQELAKGCTSKTRNADVDMGEFGMTATFRTAADFILDIPGTCPIQLDEQQVAAGSIADGEFRVTPSMLTSMAPQSKLVLEYSHTYPYKSLYAHGQTVVKWKLRFFRVPTAAERKSLLASARRRARRHR